MDYTKSHIRYDFVFEPKKGEKSQSIFLYTDEENLPTKLTEERLQEILIKEKFDMFSNVPIFTVKVSQYFYKGKT